MRNLINNDGIPFESTELQTLGSKLDALENVGRTEYRNQNTSAIAEHGAERFLIVSGPGTGKSTLFKDRIKHWLEQNSTAKILCLTFVRKLAVDLENDIQEDKDLTQEKKDQVDVYTLHKLARSIVERNHGTTEWLLKPYFQIIEEFWQNIVWDDVLGFCPIINVDNYCWGAFEKQLHNAEFDESDEWHNLKSTYFKLCKFYNAIGFVDSILRAKDALIEDINLNESDYFIIDEYQDFNTAEDNLINQLVKNSKGLLIVGDDEQALYEELRSSKPTLIRNLYKNNDYANGMLPFCSRSSFHITRSAEHFIQHNRETECIEKIYLPIEMGDDNPKVQLIACARPVTAVDYIEKFVADNKLAIDERKTKLAAGEEKDAFLLILTPAKAVKFYKKPKEKFMNIVAEYKSENRNFSDDYYKILNYYSLAKNPQNNFTFRKVLHHEEIMNERVHQLIEIAMESNQDFCDLGTEEIESAKQKYNDIEAILDADDQTMEQKIESIAACIDIEDKNRLEEDIERRPITQEKEEIEPEEIEVKKMGAIELMTIAGSKGLSADHVIIIGFDDVNMGRITKNAFYVAMTRARKSLHILTVLQYGGAKHAHDFLDQLSDDHTEYFSYKKGDQKKVSLKGKEGFKNYLRGLNRHSKKK